VIVGGSVIGPVRFGSREQLPAKAPPLQGNAVLVGGTDVHRRATKSNMAQHTPTRKILTLQGKIALGRFAVSG